VGSFSSPEVGSFVIRKILSTWASLVRRP